EKISSYFQDTPSLLWSYDHFLEVMRPLIIKEICSAELSSIWRKRWLKMLKALKEKEDDEALCKLLTLLSNQLRRGVVPLLLQESRLRRGAVPLGVAEPWDDSYGGAVPPWIPSKQTVSTTKFWKKVTQEKNQLNAEEKLRHRRSVFKVNSQVDALDVLEAARTQQTVLLTSELGTVQEQEQNTSEVIQANENDPGTSEPSVLLLLREKRKRDGDEEVLMDILGNDLECSDPMSIICLEHIRNHPNVDVVDLRMKSKFFKQLSIETAEDYHHDMEAETDTLIPDNVHNFLVNFFSQELSEVEWLNKIDDLQCPNNDDKLLVAMTRIIRRTLPQFVKAFSLGAFNPLLDITTIERPHLNAYVHPCLEATLWNVARINYEFGEIPSRNHVKRECADGVGYITGADKFQLVYVEGSKPMAREDKEVADAEKISKNLKKIFSKIVIETIKNRRRLPEDLAVFGGQSFRLRIHLFYLNYCGKYCLHEVDNSNLPRDFSEMADFVCFYESIIKWALLIDKMVIGFKNARYEKRPSRLSYASLKDQHVIPHL
ncbi:23195_t:CDS:10, partial [Dentiscutata erythropus]